jgi:Leucine-rich repeat (LRR) protein
MSRNRLRAITKDIRKLSSLKVLDVQDNNIQGLPVVLGTMSILLTFKYNKNPIVFPSEEDVRSYRCEPDLDMGKDKPDPETHQLKEYLKNYSSQISRRDGKF